jgi:hypothetical protein
LAETAIHKINNGDRFYECPFRTKKFSDEFSSSNFGRMFHPKTTKIILTEFIGQKTWLLFLKVSRAREQTRDLLISFIFPFYHFTAEPQRLPINLDIKVI